ncbi:Fe-S cluster assembly protein HesB [Mycolicibacter terrae]|uniref:Fe-S cluster assembly protein HesB n=1 Tax=Mycolicibacter terrae TaxID=1788 RepID=A0ACD2ER01_9MYCO|nr:HhH-GPD-type base excision DNA repair protein [Mycolicibacter terrae]RRR47338.1 Fe-S cluster assembly protein HesB [Mycolicibacter terrae]
MPKLQLVGDPAADALLSADPFALLVGMLLDQQIPMEVAFAGPKKIADRMGGLDPHEIAGRDPEEFAALCAEKPAVHRFPGSMAARVQALARAIVDQYGGDTAALWTVGEPDGAQVYQRLKALPGFGEQKARIFLALLGKQYGVTPPGWREAAGAYGGAGTHLSIADVVDAASLQQVRSTKKAQKQAAKQARESKGKAAT